MKSTMMKEEKSRIFKLVNQAYKWDPRIRMEEQKIQEEKEKIRLERIYQRQKEKELEEERIKEFKKQQEDKIKKAQEQLIKDREMLLSNLIKAAAGLKINLSKEDIFQITLNAKVDTMKMVLNELDSKQDESEKVKTYKTLTSSYFGLKYPDESLENSLWKIEEIHGLQKAVKKVPGGTKNRWEKIAEIVKTKSINQIIQMTHYLTTNPGIKIEADIVRNFLTFRI